MIRDEIQLPGTEHRVLKIQPTASMFSSRQRTRIKNWETEAKALIAELYEHGRVLQKLLVAFMSITVIIGSQHLLSILFL